MKLCKFATVIVAVLATTFSVSANAQSSGTGTGFYTQLSFSQPTTGNAVVDLGSLSVWNIECTGAASVSSTNKSATLTGNNSGKIWQFKSTTDATITTNTVWTVLGSLIDSISVPAYTYSDGSTARFTVQNITARWLFIGYDASLTSAGYFANASGNGTIDASAVPEPAGFVALFCGCVGLFARFRKPKSDFKS